MKISDQNILFMTKAMGLGGTENVVMQLCEIFAGQANKVVVVSNGGVQEEKLAELGIKHYLIPDIEDKSVKTLAYVSSMLKRIVREEQITVIHTHHRMAAFYVRALGLYKGRSFINMPARWWNCRIRQDRKLPNCRRKKHRSSGSLPHT